ncbi:hypothetical protein D934_02200 [Xylella fastidiosa subsp. sandyi Ann-1]|uniref:Uncharacterized protein n=1 Tax=Xylella fastidiosa subsp. sandyi Ann-1 TaxID=155920 RepID=A0A060H6S8_XYLFS|nr:hypothetical protein D934_02200 [Xylella fastidiosa subsp. sandyi Ann-1]
MSNHFSISDVTEKFKMKDYISYPYQLDTTPSEQATYTNIPDIVIYNVDV